MGLVIGAFLGSGWLSNPTLPTNPMATESYTTTWDVTIWFDISYRRAVGDGDMDGANDACADTKHDEDDLEFSHEAASLVR
ncbi:MAG: hypothetical protein ABNH26_00095 [Celeribacter sp.]|jgi:hypothetical protein